MAHRSMRSLAALSSCRLTLSAVLAAVLMVLPLPPPPAQAQSPPTGEMILRDGLVIGKVARAGRRPFSEDAVQEQIVRGTWRAPVAGDVVTGPDGSPFAWTAVQANGEGWIENP